MQVQHDKKHVMIDTDYEGPFAITINILGTPYVMTLYRDGITFSVWSDGADCEDVYVSREWSVVADLLLNAGFNLSNQQEN